MTPWFDLQLTVRLREKQYLAEADEHRQALLIPAHPQRNARRPRSLLARAYFALWWQCRPRDQAVYVVEDRRGSLTLLQS